MIIDSFLNKFPTNLNFNNFGEQWWQRERRSCCHLSSCTNPEEQANVWTVEVNYFNHLIDIITHPVDAIMTISSDLCEELAHLVLVIDEEKDVSDTVLRERQALFHHIEKNVQERQIINTDRLKHYLRDFNNKKTLCKKIDAITIHYEKLIIMANSLDIVSQKSKESTVANMLVSNLTDSSLLFLYKVVMARMKDSIDRLEKLANDQRPSRLTRGMFVKQEKLYEKRKAYIKKAAINQLCLTSAIRLSLMARSKLWLLPITNENKETRTNNFEFFDEVWQMSSNALVLRFNHSFEFYQIMESLGKDSQVFFNDVLDEIIKRREVRSKACGRRDIYIGLMCELNQLLFNRVKGPVILAVTIKDQLNRMVCHIKDTRIAKLYEQIVKKIDELPVAKDFLCSKDFTEVFSAIEEALGNATEVKTIITNNCYAAIQDVISQFCEHDFGLEKDTHEPIAEFDIKKATINSLLRYEMREILFDKLTQLAEMAGNKQLKIIGFVTESQYYLQFCKEYLFYELLCQLTTQCKKQAFELCHQKINNIIDIIFHLAKKNHFTLEANEKKQLGFIRRLLSWKLLPGELNIVPFGQKVDHSAINEVLSIFSKAPFHTLLLVQAGIKPEEIPTRLVETCIEPLVIKGIRNFACYVENIPSEKPNVMLLREYMALMIRYLGHCDRVKTLYQQALTGKETLVASLKSGRSTAPEAVELRTDYVRLYLPAETVSNPINVVAALKLKYLAVYLYEPFYREVSDEIRHPASAFKVDNCFYFAHLLASIGYCLEDLSAGKTSPFYQYIVKFMEYCFYGYGSNSALILDKEIHKAFHSERCDRANSLRGVLDFCLKEHPRRFAEVQQLLDMMLDDYCKQIETLTATPPVLFYLLERYASLKIRKRWRSKIFNIIVKERSSKMIHEYVKCMKINNRHGVRFKDLIDPGCFKVLINALETDYDELLNHVKNRKISVCDELKDLKYLYLIDHLFPQVKRHYRLDLIVLIIDTVSTFTAPEEIDAVFDATKSLIHSLIFTGDLGEPVCGMWEFYAEIETYINQAIARTGGKWNKNIALLIKNYLPGSRREADYFLLAIGKVLKEGDLGKATHFTKMLRESIGYNEVELNKIFVEIAPEFEYYFVNNYLPQMPIGQRVGRLEYYLLNFLGLFESGKKAMESLNYQRLMNIFQVLPAEQQISEFIQLGSFIEKNLYKIVVSSAPGINQDEISNRSLGIRKKDFQQSVFIDQVEMLLTKECVSSHSVADYILREPEIENGDVVKEGFGWITMMPQHIKQAYNTQKKIKKKQRLSHEKAFREEEVQQAYKDRDGHTLLRLRTQYLQKLKTSQVAFEKDYYQSLLETATIGLNMVAIFYLCGYKLAKTKRITQYDLSKILDQYVKQLLLHEGTKSFVEKIKRDHFLPFDIEAKVLGYMAEQEKASAKNELSALRTRLIATVQEQLGANFQGKVKIKPDDRVAYCVNVFYGKNKDACNRLREEVRVKYLSLLLAEKKQLQLNSCCQTESDLIEMYRDQKMKYEYDLLISANITPSAMSAKKTEIERKLVPSHDDYDKTLAGIIDFWQCMLKQFFSKYDKINCARDKEERFPNEWQALTTLLVPIRNDIETVLIPEALSQLQDEISKFVGQYKELLDDKQVENYYSFRELLQKEIPGVVDVLLNPSSHNDSLGVTATSMSM